LILYYTAPNRNNSIQINLNKLVVWNDRKQLLTEECEEDIHFDFKIVLKMNVMVLLF